MQKKIIHIDMDCFYAAVEMRDNPAYRDIPLAIGGAASRRGVISTCNYLAREYGVRSAMPTHQALKLCPDLTLVAGRMPAYKEASQQIRSILHRYTDSIEPLSLDEAYLDVSESSLFFGSATYIAKDIRKAIFDELGLTASAGIAPCKFLAKIASDENKPNGQCVITPGDVDEFVKSMPLRKIPGVGKVTQEKLEAMGLFTGKDVQNYPKEELLSRFGKFGPVLLDRTKGIDPREVVIDRVRKSVGVERTLSEDIYSREQCIILIESLYSELERRLKRVRTDMRISKQGVKLKFADFQLTSSEKRACALEKELFSPLLDQLLDKQGGRGIRLLGLNVGLVEVKAESQLALL